MATRTISAAGGNWGTAATWEEGAVPTASDDVVARSDGTSGNVTVNVSSSCRSLSFTNYSATFTHNASTNLNIGGTGVPVSGVALLFSSAMTYNRLSSSCPINFVSTSGPATITTNGKLLGTVTFNGLGGSWQLTDNLTLANTTAGSLILVAGVVDINGKTVTIGQWSCNGSLVRGLIFGAGTIITQGWDSGGSNFTITPNTGTLNVLGSSQSFNGGGTSYPTVTLSGVGDITVTAVNTFISLKRIGNANKTDTLILKANQTVTGLLQLQGNSATNRLLIQSDTLGTPRTISAGSVSLTNADFTDITATGAASPFTGTSLGDALGNSGITFTTAVTRYYVSNTNSWSSTSSWAASLGGASGASVPLPQDDVVFDSSGAAFSAVNSILTIDMPRLGRNISFANVNTTGHGVVLSHVANGVVYGNWTGKAGIAWGSTSTLSFRGRSSHTINATSAGINSNVTIAAFGGTYTLTSDLSCGLWTLTNGTFNGSTFNVTSNKFSLLGTSGVSRTLHMGSGTWTATGTGTVFDAGVSSGMTLDAGTSLLRISDTSSNGKTVNLNDAGDTTLGLYNLEQINTSTGQLTLIGGFYHNITISGGTRTVLLSADTLGVRVSGTFSVRSTASAIITLSYATTLTLQSGAVWDVGGVAGALGVIKSNTAGTQQQTVFAAGITPISDYLNIQDNYAVSPTSVGVLPYRRAWTTGSSTVQPYPVNIPPTAQPGDYLLAIIEAGNISINPAANWTEQVDSGVPSGIPQSRYAIYTKVCTAADPGTTVYFSPVVAVDNSNRSICVAISNNGGAPNFVHNIQTGSTGSDTWTGPTQTTTIKSYILDIVFAQTPSADATQLTYPSGQTLELSAIANSSVYHTVLLSRQQSAAGPVSAFSYSRTPLYGDWWASTQIAFRPLAAVYAGAHSVDSGDNLGWQFLDQDVSGPVVTITSPTGGSTVSGTVTLTATASDPSGVTGVQWQVDGTNYHPLDTASPYTDTLDTTTLTNGTHTITAIATDALANTASTSISVTVNNDFTGPTVSITNPLIGVPVSGTINLTATATDPSGVDSVIFEMDGVILSTDTTSPYSYSWDSTTVSNGTHTLRVTAQDSSVNHNTTVVSQSIYVNNDSLGPTLAITSPVVGAVLSGTIDFTASATDPSGVNMVVFSVDGHPIVADTTDPYATTYNTSLLSNGPHTFTVVAYDNSGNSSTASVLTTVLNTFTDTGVYNAPLLRFPTFTGLSVGPDVDIPLLLTTYTPPKPDTSVTTVEAIPITDAITNFSYGGHAIAHGTIGLKKITMSGTIDTPFFEYPDHITSALTVNTVPITYADLIAIYTEGRAGGQDWEVIHPVWFRDPYGRRYDNPIILDFSASYVEGAPNRVTFDMTLGVNI